MKIEILYFAGCPSHSQTVARVASILREETVAAELIEVEVKDPATAQAVGFLGSPTIRVDGKDIEPAARQSNAFGFGCRTYPDEGRRAGVPPVEWIRKAVREARSPKWSER